MHQICFNNLSNASSLIEKRRIAERPNIYCLFRKAVQYVLSIYKSFQIGDVPCLRFRLHKPLVCYNESIHLKSFVKVILIDNEFSVSSRVDPLAREWTSGIVDL